jgi:hypothetical protein
MRSEASVEMKSTKPPQATSSVSCGQEPDVSETNSVSIIRVIISIRDMKGALVFCPQLTRFAVREDFIDVFLCFM